MWCSLAVFVATKVKERNAVVLTAAAVTLVNDTVKAKL
jgi:hypothetical protein